MTTPNDRPGDRWQAPDYSKSTPSPSAPQEVPQWAKDATIEIYVLAGNEANNGMLPAKSDILAIIARHAQHALAAATEENERLRKDNEQTHYRMNANAAEILDLRAQVAQLTSERDEAATSLAEWMSTAQRRADKLTAATEEVELAELRKDKARLDWLEASKQDMLFNPNVPQWVVGNSYTRKGMGTDNLRSAIDAALNQREGEK